MNHVKVDIEGFGSYEVPRDNVQELIGWLAQKRAISIQKTNTVKEVKDNKFTGRQLIEEDR